MVVEDGVFQEAKIALSSVAPTPLYVKEAGEALVGKAVNDENISVAAGIAKSMSSPITDMRGTAEYRKHLCEVLTRRAIKTAIERANGGK